MAVDGAEVAVTDSIIDATSRRGEVAFCGRAEPSGGGLRTVTSAAERDTGDGLAAGGHLSITRRRSSGASTPNGSTSPTRSCWPTPLTPTDDWPAPLWAERRQVGCVRFSFVPSPVAHPPPLRVRAPRRRRSRRGAAPHVTALRRPRATANSDGRPIRRSAPARTTRARWASPTAVPAPAGERTSGIRLDEYLRFGLEAGFFYAT